MGIERLNQLYREVILDYGQHPRNKRKIEHPTLTTDAYNPNCGDKLKLFVCLENDKIVDASFTGEGCTLSQASADMMTKVIKGKSVEQAISLSKTISAIALGKKQSESQMKALGDAKVLESVMQFPARIKCVTIAWWGLDRILLGLRKEA